MLQFTITILPHRTAVKVTTKGYISQSVIKGYSRLLIIIPFPQESSFCIRQTSYLLFSWHLYGLSALVFESVSSASQEFRLLCTVPTTADKLALANDARKTFGLKLNTRQSDESFS